jgi:hypothetical protein
MRINITKICFQGAGCFTWKESGNVQEFKGEMKKQTEDSLHLLYVLFIPSQAKYSLSNIKRSNYTFGGGQIFPNKSSTRFA